MVAALVSKVSMALPVGVCCMVKIEGPVRPLQFVRCQTSQHNPINYFSRTLKASRLWLRLGFIKRYTF